MSVVRSSDLRRSQTLNRVVAPPDRRQRPAVPWPTGDARWRLIPPEAIPRGLQSLQALVPMRLATCAEVDCPRYLRGSTEVRSSGRVHYFVGHLSAEEIVGTGKIGMDGGRLPVVAHHPPGTAAVCDVIHKVPSGQPPIYVVDGRPVVENEFVDRLGGGVEAVKRKRG